MPVVLALLSSLLWGAADFFGGTAARRLPAAVVVGVSQAVALVVLLPLLVGVGAWPSHPWAGVAAGLVGLVGLAAFYAALAAGTMGVVAPIAATGALVPVVVGLVRGDSPSAAQVVGIVLALGGVVLASGPELSGGAPARPLALAVLSAGCFGTVAVLLAEGSKGPGGGVIGTLVLMRCVSVGAMGALAVARRSRVALGASLALLVAIGVTDVGANAAFAFATRGGLLSVVAVLGSLYPVVTVLLARQVHHERLSPIQVAGAAGTLVGVAFLSAG